MQTESSNKAMGNEETKNKGQEVQLEQFHFSGGSVYEPVTIVAASLSEATEKYHTLKKLITQ
jgi:hypothetical protein